MGLHFLLNPRVSVKQLAIIIMITGFAPQCARRRVFFVYLTGNSSTCQNRGITILRSIDMTASQSVIPMQGYCTTWQAACELSLLYSRLQWVYKFPLETHSTLETRYTSQVPKFEAAPTVGSIFRFSCACGRDLSSSKLFCSIKFLFNTHNSSTLSVAEKWPYRMWKRKLIW